MAQGPEGLNAHLEAFVRSETTLIERVYDHWASAMPMSYILMSKEEPKVRTLVLSIHTLEKRKKISPLDPKGRNDNELRYA